MLYNLPNSSPQTFMSKARQKLSKPIMVRMDVPMKQDIERIAMANGLTTSDVVRLACRQQMPSFKSGRTSLKPA